MGVDCIHVVMIGYQSSKEVDYDSTEHLRPNWDLNNDLNKTVIVEDMSGEYTYVGRVLTHSASTRWDSGCFDTPQRVSLDDLTRLINELSSDEMYNKYCEEKPELKIFTYYS